MDLIIALHSMLRIRNPFLLCVYLVKILNQECGPLSSKEVRGLELGLERQGLWRLVDG